MKILFLQKRLLFPPDTGGKTRTLNVLRYLVRWHDVTYLCNAQTSDEEHFGAMRDLGLRLETTPWRETPRDSARFYLDLAMNVLSFYPFTVSKDYDPALRRRAEQLLDEEPYDLVVCDFVQMARNAIGLESPVKILFTHNVEAQIFRRFARGGGGWLRRQYMRLQWHKMRRFEGFAGRQFDAVIAVSPKDKETFKEEYDWDHVRTIDTAVDTEYFQSNGSPGQNNRLVFVGSMDWLPNIDGVEHFVNEIWPRIKQARPDARFQIVGRNPTPAIRRLGEVEGVEVVGTVPDVRPYIQDAAVVVVPLRIGGGTRIKIFEAMAMGRPVVSTSLGAEGLPVDSGKHLVLADEPEQFAGVVVDLLQDDAKRNRMADTARWMVTDRYSAETVARQFEQICQETVADCRKKS